MNEPIWGQTAQELYLMMLRAAETMGMEDFGGKYGRYRSYRAVARHLPHIEDAMAGHLYVDVRSQNETKFYTFLRRLSINGRSGCPSPTPVYSNWTRRKNTTLSMSFARSPGWGPWATFRRTI